MARLDRQVALVTGAGRGIGRAVGLALAQAGAAVALLARSADQLAAAALAVEHGRGRALPIAADVRDAAAARRAVDEAERRLEPITFLVRRGLGRDQRLAHLDRCARCQRPPVDVVDRVPAVRVPGAGPLERQGSALVRSPLSSQAGAR
jgi:NADP-dependent 3-hydroxy acid dehydrogenase YdfG